MSLIINNLDIKIKNKIILKDINLEINEGDVVLILGPNGHGKSTLLKTIMNHYDTEIVSGSILIDDHLTNEMTTDEISRLGVYLGMQNPINIPGLSLIELLRNEASKSQEEISFVQLYKIINSKLKELNLNSELLSRGINENFSGGEKKKNEILQMKILNPKYILLDEIDSGLDVDAIGLISNVLLEEKNKGKSIIYISHDDKLFNTLKPNKTVLIINGEIVEIGGFELAQSIYKYGYDEYAKKNNIEIKKEKENDFLKDSIKGFSCGTK